MFTFYSFLKSLLAQFPELMHVLKNITL